MNIGKSDWFWTLTAIILVAIIAIGGVYIWSKFTPGELVEIDLTPEQELSGSIYVGGAVNNPGFYPLKSDDSIQTLFQAAGGLTGSANASLFKLYATEAGEEQEPQKIDINRADARLLQSLPGIGDTLAQRIIDYRQQNGPFLNTRELLKVTGIGITIYEQIESLITVTE
jgi:competence protein ComEA